MCGIAGFIDPNTPGENREQAVRRMCAAMVHRGPDDDGFSQHLVATLGMRRLAIFDPANGHQPMQTPDGRFTVIFNGAIYNFHALQNELTALGWSFRTQCDTEVLLAAFAHWGESCLRRLRGMFAFAVWDERTQSLFLARDPLGIKPLYFRHTGSQLLFASELNALAASGVVTVEVDPLSVADYLAWLAVPAPRTIYRNIFSLRPGECATFQAGRFDIRTSWNFRSIPKDARLCRSREEFIHELRGRLEDTIQAHLLADVPVGAFLSGGLDSAAVVGLMSRASGKTLRTFSIGFEESDYSEADAANATAAHFGTDHHTTVLTGARVAQDIERLLAALDQPTGDGINTYYASAAAREGGVTVALSGLGGDELFGGYPSFRATPRLAGWLGPWRALPRFLRSAAIDRFDRGDTRHRKLADVLRHARTIHEIGALQRRVFAEKTGLSILAPGVAPLLGERSPFHPELAALAADLDGAAAFEIVSAWELRTYMSDVLLRDSDVMSMRHSLELRVPLVDRPLLEWLWQQPAMFKSDPAQPKSVVREALRDLLPPELLHRPKRGFTLPFDLWMKRDLRPFLEETFSDGSLNRSGLFARTTAQQMWRGFLNGQDTREWSRVWSLAILIAFTNRRTIPAALSTPLDVAVLSQVKQATKERRPAHLPRKVRKRTLLMAPEIFASEGGITRMLQTYLKALCDLSEPDSAVRLLALNDSMIDSRHLRNYSSSCLEDWHVCNRGKWRFVRQALRLSKGCDYLVCGHAAQLPVAWLASLVRPRLRYYLVAHGIEVWRPFSLPERIALRGATKIFCVSEYTRSELLKHCSLRKDQTIVLHNALDPSFQIRPGRPLSSCSPTILTVTRLTYADRYKGVQDLIAALPAIRSAIPDARLRVIGRGDDVPRLQRKAQELNIAGAVDFTGFIDDRKLAEEMSSCRLFALPSRKEGFGLVFLEAMAHGRPCLGARAGGVPEVISSNAGVLVEYGDIAGIAAASIKAMTASWDENAILDWARRFSYPQFRAHLGTAIQI